MCIYIYIYIYIYIIAGVKLSNIIQTKPNQTVLFMFLNLLKPFIGYLHNID